MKNSISDLRNHLFDVIERLKDPGDTPPMDVRTAEAICLAAQRLIETAHVEIKFRDTVGKELEASDFLNLPAIEQEKPLARIKRDFYNPVRVNGDD